MSPQVIFSDQADGVSFDGRYIWINPTYLKAAITKFCGTDRMCAEALLTGILAHEVAHAFVFNTAHGSCLLMSGFYPAGSSCYWLEKPDWEEVMKNKFRNFSVKPNIPKENVSDDIKEDPNIAPNKPPGVYYHPGEILDLETMRE